MIAFLRARRVTIVVALLLLFAGEVAFVLSLPLPEQVNPIPDDSFFYLRIAQQFWHCGEFSFDGRNPTYGFQPLWQLLLIALQPLFAEPLRFFHAALVLCCALHVAAGAALLRLGHRLAGPWCAAATAVLWLANPAVMVWCQGIKENGLYALLWVLALTGMLTMLQSGHSRGRSARLGLCFGLMLLSRINALFAIAPALVILLASARSDWRSRLGSAALSLAVMLVVASPWYLYAWLHFGEVMPSSGAWKLLMMRNHIDQGLHLHWLHADHVQHALAVTPGYLRYLVGHGFGHFEGGLLLLLPLGAVALWRRRTSLRPGAAWLLLGILGAALLSAAANVLWLEIYLRYTDWYAVPEFVAITITGAVLASAAMQWLRRPLPRLGLALLLAAAALLLPHQRSLDSRLQLDLLRQPPRQVQLLEMGLWLRRHLPPDTAIGMWDPGIVSYFRGGLTVSCDPLMNSDDYVARFAADPLGFPTAYVREQQFAYMVGASVIRQPTMFPALPQPNGSEPSCEVLWQPYPDHDLGWSEPRWFLLVRPTASPVPATLGEQDFGFGVLYPNDPARRRLLTGDRDRLLAGLDWQADVLRLQLRLGAGASAELCVDGAVRERFAAAANGWQCLDARSLRGHRVRLQLHDAEPDAVPQAQIVDYSLRD